MHADVHHAAWVEAWRALGVACARPPICCNALMARLARAAAPLPHAAASGRMPDVARRAERRHARAPGRNRAGAVVPRRGVRRASRTTTKHAAPIGRAQEMRAAGVAAEAAATRACAGDGDPPRCAAARRRCATAGRHRPGDPRRAARARFDEYEQQVRAEYAHVPARVFGRGDARCCSASWSAMRSTPRRGCARSSNSPGPRSTCAQRDRLIRRRAARARSTLARAAAPTTAFAHLGELAGQRRDVHLMRDPDLEGARRNARQRRPATPAGRGCAAPPLLPKVELSGGQVSCAPKASSAVSLQRHQALERTARAAAGCVLRNHSPAARACARPSSLRLRWVPHCRAGSPADRRRPAWSAHAATAPRSGRRASVRPSRRRPAAHGPGRPGPRPAG